MEGSGNWQKLFEVMLGVNKNYLWLLDQQSLLGLEHRTANPFWKNVIAHWRYFISLYSQEVDLRTTPIFGSYLFNSDNLIKKRNIFETAGLIYINDLFDEGGTLYGFEDFTHTFDININFVEFYGLMHSIPRNYRILGKIDLPPNHCSEPLEAILRTPNVCKNTYQTMISKVEFQRAHIKKWDAIFGKEITKLDWEYYYTIVTKCTLIQK